MKKFSNKEIDPQIKIILRSSDQYLGHPNTTYTGCPQNMTVGVQFFSLKNSFTQIGFILKSNLLFYECHIKLFIRLLSIKQPNKLWKKTLKTIYQLSFFVGHPLFQIIIHIISLGHN